MNDKAKHFWVCAALALFGGAGLGAWWGVVLALGAGVAKEAWDSRPGGTGWDWMDLVADAAGAVCGTVALVTIKLLVGVM